MSLDATRWAWMQKGLRPSQKLVLLSLADRANERHVCWPSLRRLSLDTGLDERTVNSALRDMCAAGLISRAETKGQGYTYTLRGVPGRETATPRETVPPATDVPPPPAKRRGYPPQKCGSQPIDEPIREPANNPPTARAGGEYGFGGIGFEQFLDAYPAQRRDRGAALLEWLKLRKTASLPGLPRLLEAIGAWEATGQWQKDNGQYIPLASNFLAKRKWLDAPPAANPQESMEELAARDKAKWKQLLSEGG